MKIGDLTAPARWKSGTIAKWLWLTSALCVALTCYLSYLGGCAGDLKSAVVGDIERALLFDQYSGYVFCLSLALGAAAILSRGRTLIDFVMTFAYVAAATVATWMVAVSFETWAIQTCFPH